MSAEIDQTAIVGVEEYCLDAVSRFIKQGAELGVFNNGGNVLNMAALLRAIAVPNADNSKGVVMTVAAFEGIKQQHLIKEYIKRDDEIVIRHFLTDCPHVNTVQPQPQAQVPVYH